MYIDETVQTRHGPGKIEDIQKAVDGTLRYLVGGRWLFEQEVRPMTNDEELRRLNAHWQAAQQRSAVSSRPLPHAPARKRMGGGTRVVLGFVVMLIGLLQWLPAARFTVDGWTTWINALVGWLGFSRVVPSLLGGTLIAAMVIVGLIYSWIETKCIPFQREEGQLIFLGGMALIGWLFLTATDVGSTYTGLMTPPTNAFPAWKDIAKQPPLAALVSFYLTFAPDWFILGGVSLMGVDKALMRMWRR